MSKKPKDEVTADRMKRWKHSSFLGHASMTQSQMNAIISSTTATKEAKNLANEIYNLSLKLKEALKTRLD